MGTGGLGGFFGGWLAGSGADVAFIARGPHLEAIRANGLTVKSQLGQRHITDAQATDNTNGIDYRPTCAHSLHPIDLTVSG